MSQYKDEKTGKWYAIFRYRTYEGANKQVKKCGFATKREAKQYETEFISKMNGSKDMSVKSLSELYLADCKKRNKPASYQTTADCLKNRILPTFGHQAVKDITPIMIRTRQNEQLIPKYKKSTAIDTCRIFGTMLEFAVRYYGLPSNPMRIAGTVRYPNGNEDAPIRFWTQEQFEQFMTLIHEPMHHMIYEMLFWMGMRIGELCALRLKDIDFEQGVVHIERNKVHIFNVGDVFQTPKTATSRRTIGMPDKLKEELTEYVQRLYEPKPDDLLFPRSASSIGRYFRNTQKRNNFEPHIRLHDLRHSHASLLLNMGIPAKAIADRLGHANEIMLFRTYGHMYLEQRDELVAKLNKL